MDYTIYQLNYLTLPPKAAAFILHAGKTLHVFPYPLALIHLKVQPIS